MRNYGTRGEIGKYSVRLIRLSQCGKQRQRTILQHGIVARWARGATQHDRRRSFFRSDFIKSRLGNTEIYHIKGASNVRPPGLPHVVNVHRARLYNTGRFMFFITPDVIGFQPFEMNTGDIGIALNRPIRHPVTSTFASHTRNCKIAASNRAK